MAGYVFQENESTKKVEGRYWISQGVNIAIVACITKEVDWAAYIGATGGESERLALPVIAAERERSCQKLMLGISFQS